MIAYTLKKTGRMTPRALVFLLAAALSVSTCVNVKQPACFNDSSCDITIRSFISEATLLFDISGKPISNTINLNVRTIFPSLYYYPHGQSKQVQDVEPNKLKIQITGNS